MKRLYSPWRSKYIESFGKENQSKKCIFCGVKNGKNDTARLIVWKGKESFIVMNVFPYNSGHLMIVPYRHCGSLEELKDRESLELMNGAKIAISLLKKISRPDGFNLGVNLGRVSGAGIEGHIHLHVVPRWKGDTNFLPVLGDTKVVSQALKATYKKLRSVVSKMRDHS